MKRRLGILFLSFSIVLAMSGCGNAIPDMTDEQMDAIGEYAAITLLKYDANNRSRLVELSEEEEVAEEPQVQESQQESEEAEVPEVLPEPDDTEDENAPVVIEPIMYTMEEVLNMSAGVTVTYLGMETCESYPEDEGADDYFYLEASEGKKLLVLKLLIDNQSAAAQDIDFLHSEIRYQLKAEDKYVRNALTTMLMDDMSSYIGTLQPGGAQELVLLFELEEQYIEQSLNFTVRNGEKTYTIPVK